MGAVQGFPPMTPTFILLQAMRNEKAISTQRALLQKPTLFHFLGTVKKDVFLANG